MGDCVSSQSHKVNKQVLQLPHDVIRSNTVVSFFEAWESDFEQQNGGRSPKRERTWSAPLVSSMGDIQTSKESQKSPGCRRRPQTLQPPGRYIDRPIPDLIDRSRATSLLMTGDFHLGAPLSQSKCISTSSLPRSLGQLEETMGLPHRANCNYRKRRSGEVDLEQGQQVEVLDKNVSGWWFVHVELDSGTEQGWAPGAFLDPDLSRDTHNCTDQWSASNGEDMVLGEYRTLVDVSPRFGDEVAYKKGERVEVLSMGMDGWWKVRLHDDVEGFDVEGFTPGMNLEKLVRSPSSQAKAQGVFEEKSVHVRGLPPRRSSKKKEAEEAAPVYAEVRKPPPPPSIPGPPAFTPGPPALPPGPPLVTSGPRLSTSAPMYAQIRRTPRAGDPAMEDEADGVMIDDAGYAIPSVSTTGAARQPVMKTSSTLNYTEVVFSDPADKSDPRKGRVRRDNVEYTYINPRPLPKMPPAKTQEEARGAYENVHPNTPPPRLYENVTCLDQSEMSLEPDHAVSSSSKLAAASEHPLKRRQHTSLDTPVPHSPDAFVSLPERLVATVPVPKPRRSPKAHGHTYVNSAVPSTSAKPNQRLEASPTPAPRVIDTSNNPKHLDSSRTLPTTATEAVTSTSVLNQKSLLDSPSLPATPSPVAGRRNMAHASTPLEVSQDMKSIDKHIIHLPPVPSTPSPTLPPDAAIWWQKLPEIGDSNMIEAIWDFDGISDNASTILPFRRGDTAVLINKETKGWIGVKIGEKSGWVPAQYWGPYQPRPHKPKRNIKAIKQAESLYENKAWFVGKMGRQESEDLLLSVGQQCDFLIRESTNRVGALTLSVRYMDRARHFPIEMTPNGKYDIGKHHFTDLTRVVSYYQSHPLFFDEDETPVSLGKAINRPVSP